MPVRTKASDHPIAGEIWRAAPNGLISVSDQGRAMTMNGNLISPLWARGQVRWSYGVRGKSYGVKAASLVAEVFLGGSKSDPVNHRNGDLRDIRACNLEIPWTPVMDQTIHEAENIAEAARRLGRTHQATKRRAQFIGKVWKRQWTYTFGVPLADRLEPAKRAIEILEKAGVSDRDINLALGIPKMARRGVKNHALTACLPILFERMSPSQISAAIGWKNAYTVRNRLRSLGLIEPSVYEGRTLQGPPESDGVEEWRRHPLGVWVSDKGRVASWKGLLSVQRRSPTRRIRTPFVMIQTHGRSQSAAVARLMLDAFRPKLTYSPELFVNGDVSDVRLSNIRVPIDVEAAAQAIKRRPLFGLTPDQIGEVRQDALTAMLEGRALTVGQAVYLAKKERHDFIGTHRAISLDTATADGRTGHDRLTSEGRMVKSAKASSSRPTL